MDLLIKLAAGTRVANSGRVSLEIVGVGQQFEALLEQARDQGVTDILRFVPFQQDIWGLLAGWDAAILTSDHEGLPMICLEALACGVPVFARNVGGLRELVLGPEQGVLVDSSDPAELAARLVEFLATQVEVSGRRSRLPSSFTAESMCEGYLRVYERVKMTA